MSVHIRKLHIKGLGIIDDARITLPEKGVVLVTGSNGQGKSTMTEAVAQLWNKSVRKANLWRKKQEGFVQIEFDNVQVNKKKPKSGSVKMQYAIDGGKLSDYATASKAHDHIAHLLPPWEVWRRTSVLDSEEAGQFTAASDANRKQLIEMMAGADQYDPALKAARKDLAAAEKKLSRCQREIAVLEERVKGYDQRLADLDAELEVEPPSDVKDPKKLEERVAKLTNAVKMTKKDLRDVREELTSSRDTVRDAQNEYRAAEREAERLAEDTCPTCGQEIGEELRASLQERITSTKAALADAREQAKARDAELEAEIEELEDELEDVQTRRRTTERELEKAKAGVQRLAELEAARRRHEELYEKGAAQRRTALTALADQEDEADTIQSDCGELEAAVCVLGYRGYRAHVLGETLEGLEELANSWLERIGWPGLAIRLKPYKEKGDNITEKISLEIEGVEHEEGYKACSKGQKRRIDVALLFAFREYACAAMGADAGTLWLDEIFDGLDDEGITAVSEAIAELAQDRCVVVISHRPELCAALQPVLHLVAADRTIRSKGA